MCHKIFVSMLLLTFIAVLNPVYAEHGGFDGHDHASKPVTNKLVNTADVSVFPGEAVTPGMK